MDDDIEDIDMEESITHSVDLPTHKIKFDPDGNSRDGDEEILDQDLDPLAVATREITKILDVKTSIECCIHGCEYNSREDDFVEVPPESQMQGKLWRNTFSKFTPIPKQAYVCSGHFMDGTPSKLPSGPDYFPRFHLPANIKFPTIKIVVKNDAKEAVTAKDGENLQIVGSSSTADPTSEKSKNSKNIIIVKPPSMGQPPSPISPNNDVIPPILKRKTNCAIPRCNNIGLDFLLMPIKSTPQGMLWRSTLKITEENSVVCRSHFLSGNIASNPEDPDFFPTQNLPPGTPTVKIAKKSKTTEETKQDQPEAKHIEDRIEAKDLNTLAKRSRDSEIINEAVGNIEAFGSNWIPTEDSESIFVQPAKRRKVFTISQGSETEEIANSEVIPAKIRLALNDHTEYLREYEKVKSVPILKSFKKELGEKCCVKTCLSREGVDDVEFFPFSLDGAKNWKKSAAWMFAIDRKKLLTTAKICGYHFKDGVCLHSTHPQFNQNRNILRIDSKTELIKDDHESEGAKCGYIIFQGLNERYGNTVCCVFKGGI